MNAKLVKILERTDHCSTVLVEVMVQMKIEIREGGDVPDHEMLDTRLTCDDEFVIGVVEAISEDSRYIAEVDRICG